MIGLRTSNLHYIPLPTWFLAFHCNGKNVSPRASEKNESLSFSITELKILIAKTQLQPKRWKPILKKLNFLSSVCKNHYLLPFFNSSPTKSPLFDFHSPPKTPCCNSNPIFLNSSSFSGTQSSFSKAIIFLFEAEKFNIWLL